MFPTFPIWLAAPVLILLAIIKWGPSWIDSITRAAVIHHLLHRRALKRGDVANILSIAVKSDETRQPE